MVTNLISLLARSSHVDLDQKELSRQLKQYQAKDWDFFYRQTCRHGLVGLVYPSLKELALLNYIPEDIHNNLVQKYLLYQVYSDYMRQGLKQVLSDLERLGIDAIPLKGVALSLLLYPDGFIRYPGVDIDILIRKKDSLKIEADLSRLGYIKIPTNEIGHLIFSCLSKKVGMLELRYLFTYYRDWGPVIDEMWQRAEFINLDGFSFLSLSAEDLLLYLSIHLAESDHFRRLGYLCDINELILKYKESLNWESILDKAKRYQIKNSLYYALTKTKSFFATPINKDILTALKPSIFKKVLVYNFIKEKNLFYDNFSKKVMDRYLISYILFELLELNSFRDFFRFIKNLFLSHRRENESILKFSERAYRRIFYQQYV